MQYYVDIDIAKLNHFASVVSPDGEVLVKPFKFSNDNDDFCRLLSALASYVYIVKQKSSKLS